MNNSEISFKLKYILHELGMNKTEFLKACQVFNPSISKPTILNAINGNNTVAPSIETLSTIIKVCQTSGNEKLKYISYDFILNENIKEVEANNAKVYQEIGLSDDVINKLKQLNHPIYYDFGNIINYYLYHMSIDHFKYLNMFKITCDIRNEIKKENIKSILKLFDNDWYLEYIERNFRNIYDLYLKLKNKKEVDYKKLDSLLEILSNNLKYKLLEFNRKLYENIEM